MQYYCESFNYYKRLRTLEVRIGDLLLGNPGGDHGHPIRVQTMTTTDTMDTKATVEQSIRCIEAGSELIRITAPSRREAENLLNIKNELRARGYKTPIVADIHFTPNAAEIAARIVEKVRINPGNYIDKKKFEIIEYSDTEYREEIQRIRDRFVPLIKICKEYGTAMRIGTNHGSLSDRIMSRYGDTANGMVESAMEFLRIARDENYHQIVLSMKSSNPQVMVHAYRLLVKTMFDEFGECYPLHLGVTEAGDGEDARIKSAVGIGTLLEDGLGDTIRVSLTEDPELEIPVCKALVNRYANQDTVPESSSTVGGNSSSTDTLTELPYDPFNYNRRKTFQVGNIGNGHVPAVIADFRNRGPITVERLQEIGYNYEPSLDKWNIDDVAADYLFADGLLNFPLPGTLKVIVCYDKWANATDKEKYLPFFDVATYLDPNSPRSSVMNFILVQSDDGSATLTNALLMKLRDDPTVVICMTSKNKNAVQTIRRLFLMLEGNEVRNPAVVFCNGFDTNTDRMLVNYGTEGGALLLDGFGDGVCICHDGSPASIHQLNSIAFGILQATRTRISKTEYISCPSCGRTLFDLQETTAKIRAVTNHLKGVKIAIMGCIVNGPGEMADADFGYVGSGQDRITLYRGREIVKRNVKSDVAVEELVNLLKENNAWVEP